MSDAEAASGSNDSSMFQRFDQYVSLSEGVICDLRQNNGRTSKYNAF